jgi:hypothetical protein
MVSTITILADSIQGYETSGSAIDWPEERIHAHAGPIAISIRSKGRQRNHQSGLCLGSDLV